MIDEQPIRVRNKSGMLILEKKNISEEKLYSMFMEDPSKTVHILENDILTGIITLYDFQKNQLSKTKLINKNFKRIDIDNENMALKILKEKRKYRSIPVVDAQGKLIKEYYREGSMKEQVPFSYIVRACQEAVLGSGYDEIVLLMEDFSIEETIGLKNIIAKADNVIIKNSIEISEIKELTKDKTCIVDFDTERYKVRKILYEKKGIKSYGIDSSISKLERGIYFISRQYQNIAVVGEDNLFGRLVASECNVQYLEPEKCFMRKDGIYEYKGDIDCEIEVVFALVDFSMEAHMVAKNKKVPLVSFFDGCNEALYGCYDMIYNIIPKFKEKQINYLIIERIDYNRSILPEINREIEKRGKICEQNRDAIMDALVKNKKVADELKEATTLETKNGIIQRINYTGKFVNRINGERYTWNNPEKFKHTIYLYGPCLVAGDFVEDKETIASHLQQIVGQDYCVKNYGSTWQTITPVVRRNQYKPQDVVIIFAYDSDIYRKNGLKMYNLIEAYRRVPDLPDHVWNTFFHCDKVVMRSIAEELGAIIQKENFQNSTNEKNNVEIVSFGINQSQNQIEAPWQVKEWIASVEKYKADVTEKNVGAIVMNCNPFTNGHRYLIEQALKQVDILYVFVVEEDKSFFKFKDRLAMVKAGTADLQNVIVIPSGKYIISTTTLPGYFEKESKPNVEFDAATDLEIFAGAIAKAFDISIRFAGEEPVDEFTNRYNQFMRRILPSYGIKFCEIPRKCMDGNIISASVVRKYMKEKRYDKVKKLVMPVVYEYLKESYFSGP